MKVYKGYLIAIKRNISTIILYCTIFLGVAVSMVYLSGREQTGGSYAQMRLSIGVVDRDNSLWSHALEDYLEKYHDVTVMKDDMDKLAEAVYSSQIRYAVLIPEGFYEDCIQGKKKVESVTESGSQWEYYVNGRIDDFINSARVYLAGGYSQEEAMKNWQSSTFGVIGLGRFGTALAKTLAEAEKEVIVVDCNEEKVRELRHYTEYAYVTDNLSKDTLQEIGIQNCGTVIVCIGEKIDTSILTTLNVVSLGVPHVIAKAISSDQGAVLEKIGAEVVYPERDMALRLGKRLIANNNFLDFITLSNEVEIQQVQELFTKVAGTPMLYTKDSPDELKPKIK